VASHVDPRGKFPMTLWLSVWDALIRWREYCGVCLDSVNGAMNMMDQ
jgi:hypothetical protein